MAEDRMLNDEILLGLIKANSGGGGGGTTDYEDLDNLPKINSVELKGNKSLSDLGIASAQSVTNITNGESINNFAGVETALATKQTASDNSLETDAKTIVGAINENASNIGSLKSGLTDLSEEVNGDAVEYPYADVITIPDAVPSNLADCSVKIEPVQDLHGYDHPWVGGAGKNKLPMTLDGIKAANTSGTWSGNVYTFNGATFTIQTDSAGNITGIIVNGTLARETEFYVFRDTSNSCPFNDMLLNGCINGSDATYDLRISDITTTSTKQTTGDGEIINVNATGQWRCTIMIRSGYAASNLIFYPMIRLSTETDATFAPYTNICPITGHTEASVQRDGKNLCDKGEGNVYNGGKLIPVSAGDKIYCYGEWVSDNKSFYGAIFSTPTETSKGNKIAILDDFYTGVSKEMTISTNGYFGVCFDTSVESYTVSKMMISKTPITSASDYVPYAGKTYTIALGDTIYGGTVDFDSGVMTVTHKYMKVTDLTRSNNTLFYKTLSDAGVPNNYTVLCDREKTANQWGDVGVFTDQYGAFMLKTSEEYTSAADCLTAYGGELNICYPLATPTTIQLTPQQIQLLKGTNTLTASTGQISVTVNGVSGAIGAVQEQVNELTEEVAEIKPLNYSTTEQKTGQKWIDGKDIYQRSFDITFTAATANWTLFDNSVSYDKLINVISVLINENGEVYPILQDKDSSPRFHSYNNAIEYYTQLSSTLNYVITLQYTKATT